MKDWSTEKVIFIADHKDRQQFQNPDQKTSIIHRPALVGPEISFSVDSPDLQQAIALVTSLCPDKAFCFLNEQLLWQQAKHFQKHFLPKSPEQAIAYAIKANPRARILEILAAAGMTHTDCSSLGEISKVQQYSPSITPLYCYPSIFRYERERALDAGVRYFTVEDEEDIRGLLQGCRDKHIPETEIEITIRVSIPNPDADIDLSKKCSQSIPETLRLLKLLKTESQVRIGLSTNTGSQNRNPQSYARAVKILSQLANSIEGVNSFNFGGGFPVNYSPLDQYKLQDYLETLTKAVRQYTQDLLLDPDPKVIIEPGRAMVAEAVDLIIPIRRRKSSVKEDILVIDDGIYTCFIDAIVHDWKYYFDAFGQGGRKLDGRKIPYKIRGRSCDAGDALIQTPTLPANLQKKDYIHLRNSGAYTDSTSTISFNGFRKPEYISYNLLVNLPKKP